MRRNYGDRLEIPLLGQDYESFIKNVCGGNWRVSDRDGGLGVAIGKAILDGTHPELFAVAEKLDLNTDLLSMPYERLTKNGYMKSGRIREDRELLNGNVTAWCYLAGIASGLTGVIA